jgi:histidinol-phosphate aminotransferase
LRFRTFSKAHGMAGLRVGYAFGAPEVVAAFDRVRNHFGVNRVAQAGALASLADGGHIMSVVARVERARLRIAAIAAHSGLQALPSATNFVTVDCGRDGAFARAVLAGLAERDVFIRMPGVPPLDRCIRISTAPDDELDVLAAELPSALAAADGCVRSTTALEEGENGHDRRQLQCGAERKRGARGDEVGPAEVLAEEAGDVGDGQQHGGQHGELLEI